MDLCRDVILKELRKIQGRELFTHSKATSQMAVSLAENLNIKNPSLKIDIKKVEIASLLHDWAKGFSKSKLIGLAKKYKLNIDDFELKNPGLLHGPVGAAVVEKKLGVKDRVILKAIKNHTTGDSSMSVFDKIIFVADHIEMNRDYRMVEEIRGIAVDDFKQAVIMVIENKIFYVLQKRALLHPKTISAWNAAIKEQRR
ncbi:MAG: bis(5'-nucleosyl)-tetraphosphatase (symmetrical) YqeK [bacterium]|nr:bis(5'-nucleosyl)-tetraphosphatase (symmetrical) YqeK [bacterium]